MRFSWRLCHYCLTDPCVKLEMNNLLNIKNTTTKGNVAQNVPDKIIP